MSDQTSIEQVDPEIARLIEAEQQRQAEKIRLIPSENYVSRAVLEATGSVLTNKYSEGYPGKRYYEGQQFIDPIEELAGRAGQAALRRRARQRPALLGLARPTSPSISRSVEPGDTVMGMALPMGGHLTHGWNVSVTGKWFRSVQYGVRADTGMVDMDEVRELALRGAAQAHLVRRHRHPAHDRLRRLRRDRRRGRRDPGGGHRPHRRAGGGWRPPLARIRHADVISTTTHKTLRGPAGRC